MPPQFWTKVFVIGRTSYGKPFENMRQYGTCIDFVVVRIELTCSESQQAPSHDTRRAAYVIRCLELDLIVNTELKRYHYSINHIIPNSKIQSRKYRQDVRLRMFSNATEYRQ